MNIEQFEAICAIVRSGFNISRAAETVNKSQSGLSRQVKALETELGVQIFSRTRNKLMALTPHGERILQIGQRIMLDVRTVRQIGTEDSSETPGELRIATTHVHARYSL